MLKALVVGTPVRIQELVDRNLSNVEFHFFEGSGIDDLANQAALMDIVFDLNLDDQPIRLQAYHDLNIAVFVCAVKVQLAEMVYCLDGELKCRLIGINSLPSFLNRPLLECSVYKKEDISVLENLTKEMEWDIELVEDRVGMVTPRVISMIINEACYTLQEGTASVKDIDLGMKLGTNFPMGPFEWANKLGLENVVQILSALHEDTKEERYKICPLLKTYFLKAEEIV